MVIVLREGTFCDEEWLKGSTSVSCAKRIDVGNVRHANSIIRRKWLVIAKPKAIETSKSRRDRLRGCAVVSIYASGCSRSCRTGAVKPKPPAGFRSGGQACTDG